MKVVLTVEDPISPTRGGGAFRILSTGKEFRKRGHDVKFYAHSNKSIICGIPVESIPVASQTKSIFGSTANLMIILFYKLVKNRRNIDLVFAHNIAAAIPALVFCRLFRKKFVYDMTDIQTEYFLENKPGKVWKQIVKGLVALEYFVIKLSPRVIVVTEAMREVLIKNGVDRNKISVVYDGVDIDEFSSKKEKKDFIKIVHHGGICPHDGVPLIPKAAKHVLAKCPDTKFYILAEGIDMHNVKRSVAESNVGNSFVFTGWVSYEDMKEHLRTSDIGLIARTDIQPNNTVITLKLLDYWASGNAVVAPRLRGISEVSTHGKDILLFEPGNEKSLADAIIKLIEDKKLLKRLQENGNKTVQDFDWPLLAKKIADTSLAD